MKGVFITALFALGVLSGILNHGILYPLAWSMPNAAALPNATLSLSPTKAAGLKNQTISINANIADIVDLFSFQISIRFDPDAVECLNATEGGFLSNNGADTMLSFPGTINNTEGSMIPYGWSLINITEAKSGSGVLANFVFHMKKTGYSDLHIRGFIAMDTTGTNMIPVNTVDVYTPLRDQSECSISIVGNAQGDDGGYSAYNISNAFPFLENHRLSFNITGSPINSNAFAFCNVSIPKSLLWANYQGLPDDGWWLLLNDNSHTIKTTYENATHTSLYFEFSYNASNPTTRVRIETAIDLEHPYPNAVLSVSTDKWWYSRGEAVTVKARFTINDVPIPNAIVLLKVIYPNMSLCLSFYNITEPNGNAMFTFPITQDMPFGNYTIHLLAGKVGVPGACETKFFWVWRRPLIEPYPWQYANYRYHMDDNTGALFEYGWWNITYMNYLEPNLINCSAKLFIISQLQNLSLSVWTHINTTTRWIPEANSSDWEGTYFRYWIQTNVSMGSQIAISNTTGTVIGNKIVFLRMSDGTVGFVGSWVVEFQETPSMLHTVYSDKKTGLCVYEKVLFIRANYTAYVELADSNVPIAYKWGDINEDGTVNSTDVALMQSTWQAGVGDVNYDPDIDFNGDGVINIADATLIGFNWQRRHEVLP